MSATGRGAERNPADYYPTPAWCTRRILGRLGPRLPGGAWLEPGAGGGHVAQVVREMRPDVTITGVDLRTERQLALEWAADRVVYGADFLTWAAPERYSVAVGNPPYGLARQFVDRARVVADQVLFLLRLNWLGGAARADFLRATRPDVYVLPNRPSFAGNGRTDATEYAWFHWYPGSAGCWAVLPQTPAAERRAPGAK